MALSEIQLASDRVVFTRRGVLLGLRRSVPIAVAVFTYGLVFGVLASQSGLSLAEAALMSGVVFAGSSQFAALGIWHAPLQVGAIALTTLIINLRHVLMGAAMYPWLSKVSRAGTYPTLFLMNDEGWALTMGYLRSGGRDVGFALGAGLTIFAAWLGSTVVGNILGQVLADPARWGLDFAFTAVFVALLVGLWRGRCDLLPWVVAAGVAIATAQVIPGNWHIIAGGLAGSLVGALRDDC